VERLAALVGCETPSGHRQGLDTCYDLLAAWASPALGRPQRLLRDGVPHLHWPASAASGGVLLLCHADTVWPLGTVAQRPFRRKGDRLTGPGVFDMKAGDRIGRARPRPQPYSRQPPVTGDEEAGSLTSRPLIEDAARSCAAVLILEPSEGDAAKTARKGAAFYRLSFRGRAARTGEGRQRPYGTGPPGPHAQQSRRPDLGTTVTPTVAHAGTTVNTIPETAELAVDVRAWNAGELQRVDQELRKLGPHSAEVASGVNRYPLEADQSAPLLARARAVAAERRLPDIGEATSAVPPTAISRPLSASTL
jgi:glutamate carboxypeptidase